MSQHLGRSDRPEDIVVFEELIPYLERSYSRRSDVVNNTTTTAVVYLQHQLTDLRGGDYKIEIPYVWSYNSATRDIIVDIVIDGTVVELHRIEPKDVAGNDGGTGAGTDQRISGYYSDIVNLSAGDHTISLRHRSSQAGIIASLHKGAIIVERFLDV